MIGEVLQLEIDPSTVGSGWEVEGVSDGLRALCRPMCLIYGIMRCST